VALNIADLFEHAVDAVPEAPALKVRDRVISYAELDAEANRLAHYLAGRGLGHGDHIGVYAKNSIEHVVAVLAIFKIRAVAINVNYRYVDAELDYLFGNADLKGLIFEREYGEIARGVLREHPAITTRVVIPQADDFGTSYTFSPEPSCYGAVTLAEAQAGQSPKRDFEERSGDDVHIIYTGGTTGFPKGVMWRHEDFWRVLGGGIDFMSGERLEEYDQSKKAAAGENTLIGLPLSPLMHGGAQAALLMHLFAGMLTLLSPKFDPVEVWETIDREKVQLLFMTGDAMARPLIETYEKGDYDGSSLFAVASSAAIFSKPVKERWMAAFPNAVFTDSVGASETGFTGTGLQDKDDLRDEGTVIGLGAEAVVLDEDDKILDPATDIGAVGRLARARSVPLGYYKDPEKSARTFIEIDGVRYAVPGDYARIEEGGRVRLLGRGSNCVNTGGEKVYPEEVESALKKHPAVYDALVVGVPDGTYGQAVAAVVQVRAGHSLELEGLRSSLRNSLSGYKLPRWLTIVEEIPRNAAGKAQYPVAKQLAMADREARS
jgi:acyl-CoA synthetase (AMP-forming)/AMP-acid ligase II